MGESYRLQGNSDDLLRASSGRGWGEWFVILDMWEGDKTSWARCMAYLMHQYPISRFWAQMVAMCYARERLRIPVRI